MPEYNPTIREKWVLNGPLVKISEIKPDKENITLDVDETAEIKTEVQPYNASDKVVIWTSSNPLVASVDRYCVVTAHSSGSEEIIARALENSDKQYEARCKVKVKGVINPIGGVIEAEDYSSQSGINTEDCNEGGSGYLFNVNWWSLEYNEKGDCNSDGSINIADLVALQKWILGKDTLKNWNNADMNSDNKLNSSDIVLLRKQLINIK